MPETYRSSALEKALAVLEAILEHPQAVGLPDLAARLGLPSQTVHRLLVQLERSGLVVRDPSRERYSVGPRLSRLAVGTLRSLNQAAPIRSILKDLVDDVGETCNLGVLDDLGLRLPAAHRMPLAAAIAYGNRQPHGRAYRVGRQGAAGAPGPETVPGPPAKPQAEGQHVAYADARGRARDRARQNPLARLCAQQPGAPRRDRRVPPCRCWTRRGTSLRPLACRVRCRD